MAVIGSPLSPNAGRIVHPAGVAIARAAVAVGARHTMLGDHPNITKPSAAKVWAAIAVPGRVHRLWTERYLWWGEMPAQCVRSGNQLGDFHDSPIGMRRFDRVRELLTIIASAPQPQEVDPDVDYILSAIGRPVTAIEYSKLSWPVRMAVTAFDAAPAADPDTRSRIKSFLATYREVEAAVQSRGHIGRTLTTFFKDMERLLSIAAKVSWQARSGIVTSLTHRWTMLLSQRRRMDFAEAVVDEWRELIHNIVCCISPDQIPAFDVVRFREAFVDVISVLVADRRSFSSLKDALVSRGSMFRLAIDTGQALSPARDLSRVEGWNDLPPLVRLAAIEYAAGQGRSVLEQRTAMRATAERWANIWPEEPPSTRWMPLLVQLLGDEKLPARFMQHVAAGERVTVGAGWVRAARSAFGAASSESRLTVHDLDRAVKSVRTEVERSLMSTQ